MKQKKTVSRGSPEAHCVGQGRVAVAVSGMDGGAVAQQVLHHLEVALARRDVQRRAAVVVAQTQVAALVDGTTHVHRHVRTKILRSSSRQIRHIK